MAGLVAACVLKVYEGGDFDWTWRECGTGQTFEAVKKWYAGFQPNHISIFLILTRGNVY